MKKLLLYGSLLAAGAFSLQDVSQGHGGTYLGPGDTVPPGGGGGGEGGPPTPAPSGPSNPGGGGPSSGVPPGPAVPGQSGPSQGGPATGGAAGGADLTLWQFWWGFNQPRFLNLRSHIHSQGARSGSDEFFLGFGQQPARETLRPSEETVRETIVPALLEALETERNNDIVTGALMALAKIGVGLTEDGTSEFSRVFVTFLDDSTQEIAETAAIALGVLGGPESREILEHLLLDDEVGRQLVGSEGGVDYRTRAFAAFGLGQIGHSMEDPGERERIVEVLWRVCEMPRQSTRDLKVAGMISLGLVPLDPAVPGAVAEELSGGEAPRTRQGQFEYLLEVFESENDKRRHLLVRAHAPRSMVRLLEGLDGETRAAMKTRLVEALAPYVGKRGKGQRELRQSASLAFGLLGDLDGDPEDVEIRERLLSAAANVEPQVKNFSVLALGQVGGRPGDGEEPRVGEDAVRTSLLKHLVRGRTMVKPWAGLGIGLMERGLGDTGSATAVAALRDALASAKTPREVGAFAIGLGIAGDAEAEPVLLDKLESMSHDETRGYLAVSLGLIDARGAIAPIQEVVAESKYRGPLLQSAAIGLGLLGDKQLVTQLVGMLREAKTLTTQAAIASALGFIGDKQSVEPLVAMLQDDSLTGAARGFAAVALGIVAEQAALPWNAKFGEDINYRANTTTLTGNGATGLLDIL